MKEAFICDSIRTPIGRYGGGLSSVRPDDLAAISLRALMDRNSSVQWDELDDCILGCANQAGEDNRNVARMASLLAGIPVSVPGTTINRLCASGLNAVGAAAQAIKSGDADFLIAGGVESMSRAPLVVAKAATAFSRNAEMYDTTIGWRFVNPEMQKRFGTDPLPQTAENVASKYKISREDQDRFAYWSQEKAAAAQKNGLLAEEIVGVQVPQRKGESILVENDEHLRFTPLEKLAKLRTLFSGGTVTAANSSGINDGAGALLLATEGAAARNGLEPQVRILGMASAGVHPGIMGMGPVPATNKLLKRLSLSLDDIDIIELNEAFAAQALACTRELGLEDNDPRINPLGGAIALGHPLGMSGARLVITATQQLLRTGKKRALCTMCVGVGQGVAVVVERV